MPLSNIVLSEETRERVLEFVPPRLELGTPEVAKKYMEGRSQGRDFNMHEATRIQTGVKDVESRSFDERVEQRVLERLQDVQEAAYKEAYSLGMEEGRREAFQKTSVEIDSHLNSMQELLASITQMKTEILHSNEAHVVKLLLHMASRLAYVEVNANNDVLKEAIRTALEMAQLEENITIQVAPEQFEFLETLKKETGREYEFLKKVKIEPVVGLTKGGCVIETNFGEIDSRFEERVSQLWKSIEENLHRVKDRISAA